MENMSLAYAALVAIYPRAFSSETLAHTVLVLRKQIKTYTTRKTLPDEPVDETHKKLEIFEKNVVDELRHRNSEGVGSFQMVEFSGAIKQILEEFLV